MRIPPYRYADQLVRASGLLVSRDDVRSVEYLPNGFYRVDWRSGLVECFERDAAGNFTRRH